MSIYEPLSDQLFTWSANHAGQALSQSSAPTLLSPASTAAATDDPAGLADRALQTLRQAQLQMRHRSRPRSQALSVHQPQVREYLANYQRTRQILEEICTINRELLRRRERL